MITDTREKIVEFIRRNGRARVSDLVEYLEIGNVAVHRQLKRLTADGVLAKLGAAPKVFYVMADLEKINKIILDESLPTEDFDRSILENISWSYENFRSHREIAKTLFNKRPYTVTVVIEHLNYKLWNKKEYVKKTRVSVPTKFKQTLYKMFFEECGENEGNKLYGKWLDKYRSIWLGEGKLKEIDDYIIVRELEPRYKQKILKKFKNRQALFGDRFITKRQRYYRLPEPLDYIDWRTPFDNIFVWEENGKKMARRGGSGSSGSRETNSMFSFGFLEINKRRPVPSYVFFYSGENKLRFVKKFERLCLPIYDIGSNYYLDSSETKKIKKGGMFLKWTEREKVDFLEVSKDG